MNGSLFVADPLVRVEVLTYLRACGLSVKVGASGVRCLESVARRPPDAVVTELVLEDMEAADLIWEIRQVAPLVPIVLLTGNRRSMASWEMDRIQADGYFFKPVAPEALVRYLRPFLPTPAAGSPRVPGERPIAHCARPEWRTRKQDASPPSRVSWKPSMHSAFKWGCPSTRSLPCRFLPIPFPTCIQ